MLLAITAFDLIPEGILISFSKRFSKLPFTVFTDSFNKEANIDSVKFSMMLHSLHSHLAGQKDCMRADFVFKACMKILFYP